MLDKILKVRVFQAPDFSTGTQKNGDESQPFPKNSWFADFVMSNNAKCILNCAQSTPDQGAINCALMNVAACVGPLIGIFGSAISLGSWVDLKNQNNIHLEPDDDNWIGAWWLPFFADAIVGILLFILLFGFPDQIPGSADIKRERDKTSTIYSTITTTSKLIRVRRIDAVFYRTYPL